MPRVRKYLVLASQTLQGTMAYRVQYLVNLLSGLVQALVLYYIWQAVYQGRVSLNGYTLADMVTYIFVSYAVKNLYSFYTETRISSSVRDGSVAMDLIRPMNYQLARFAESVGSVVVEGVLIGVLVALVGGALFGMRPPAGVVAGCAFGASVVLSMLVNFSLCYAVGLVSFWTTTVYGIVNSKRFIVDFLSGGLVPLAFFPGWLGSIARVLPFESIVHVPVSIYLGRISGAAIVSALLRQAAWAVVLWVAGVLVWMQARKRITIHGG